MTLDLVLFWIPGAVAIAATVAVITRKNASRALVYLVVSLLAVAVIFFMLGAPFAAALEVVVYAGAIVVLFLFVVMMLNLGKTSVMRETRWLQPGMWIGPFNLVALFFQEAVEDASGTRWAALLATEQHPRYVRDWIFGVHEDAQWIPAQAGFGPEVSLTVVIGIAVVSLILVSWRYRRLT